MRHVTWQLSLCIPQIINKIFREAIKKRQDDSRSFACTCSPRKIPRSGILQPQSAHLEMSVDYAQTVWTARGRHGISNRTSDDSSLC